MNVNMNKYKPHVYLIPEDDADRQIANGFVNHYSVNDRQIKVLPEAGGWTSVRDTFVNDYVQTLKSSTYAYLVMLIDFDRHYASRRAEIGQAIPDDLKERVFVVGTSQTPEDLKRELGRNFEQIGLSLAEDCHHGVETVWGHAHLKHNDPDRQRLMQIVKPILFIA